MCPWTRPWITSGPSDIALTTCQPFSLSLVKKSFWKDDVFHHEKNGSSQNCSKVPLNKALNSKFLQGCCFAASLMVCEDFYMSMYTGGCRIRHWSYSRKGGEPWFIQETLQKECMRSGGQLYFKHCCRFIFWFCFVLQACAVLLPTLCCKNCAKHCFDIAKRIHHWQKTNQKSPSAIQDQGGFHNRNWKVLASRST